MIAIRGPTGATKYKNNEFNYSSLLEVEFIYAF